MLQEFTKEEKRKAKLEYKNSIKFNPDHHNREKAKLQSLLIDTKKKSKPNQHNSFTEESRTLTAEYEGKQLVSEFVITKHRANYNIGWFSQLILN